MYVHLRPMQEGKLSLGRAEKTGFIVAALLDL